MADELDMASAQEEMTLNRALAAQSAAAALTRRTAARGYCINRRCAEEFTPGDTRLFCDSRCAAEHQRFPNH